MKIYIKGLINKKRYLKSLLIILFIIILISFLIILNSYYAHKENIEMQRVEYRTLSFTSDYIKEKNLNLKSIEYYEITDNTFNIIFVTKEDLKSFLKIIKLN